MPIIKVVGESWCPFTNNVVTGANGAWQAINGLTNPQGIVYQKLDCAAAKQQDDLTNYNTFCKNVKGYPSFVDSEGTVCARGFDRTKGIGDITTQIEEIMDANGKC